MVEKRIIYFNEALHRYTDQFGNEYTSVTTKLKEYEPSKDFKLIALACERIGKNRNHRDYLKYKGKTANQLLNEWKVITDKSLVRGNTEHGYLEETVKIANGHIKQLYKSDSKSINGYSYSRMYSIHDLVSNRLDTIGSINVDDLLNQDLNVKYVDIYNLIVGLSNRGFKFYPEIVVYHPDILVCGMIDLLAVKDNTFIIIDWKTNKGDIRFESGYYEKDTSGELSDNFIYTNEFLKYPLSHVPASVGNKYTLQLSLYANFVERFGFNLIGLILFHITHEVIKVNDLDTWKTNPIKLTYMKNEIDMLINNINLTNNNKKNQYDAFKL